MNTSWAVQPFAVFDLESTGVDTREDRIVTGYVATVRLTGTGREILPGTSVIINPGVPIPAEASAVHGITDDVAQAKGRDPRDSLHSIAESLYRALIAHIPVVTFNGAYDVTLLHNELIRHGLPTLGERLGRSRDAGFGPVIDAHVLDKHVEQYRPGSRKLMDTCRAYGIDLDETQAHAADFDAVAAGRLAVRIARKYPVIGAMGLRDLHLKQKDWHARQKLSLQQYLNRTKDPAIRCDPCWPICTDPTHASS